MILEVASDDSITLAPRKQSTVKDNISQDRKLIHLNLTHDRSVDALDANNSSIFHIPHCMAVLCILPGMYSDEREFI